VSYRKTPSHGWIILVAVLGERSDSFQENRSAMRHLFVYSQQFHGFFYANFPLLPSCLKVTVRVADKINIGQERLNFPYLAQEIEMGQTVCQLI